nr:hypothetical protein [Cressdnaviricota sp.]
MRLFDRSKFTAKFDLRSVLTHGTGPLPHPNSSLNSDENKKRALFLLKTKKIIKLSSPYIYVLIINKT